MSYIDNLTITAKAQPHLPSHQSLALPLKITIPFFLNFLGAASPAEAAETADAEGAGLLADDVAGASPDADAGLLADEVAAPVLFAAPSPAEAAFLAGAVLLIPASLAS